MPRVLGRDEERPRAALLWKASALTYNPTQLVQLRPRSLYKNQVKWYGRTSNEVNRKKNLEKIGLQSTLFKTSVSLIESLVTVK